MQKIVLITALNSKDPYNTLGVNLGPLYLAAYISANSKVDVYIVEDISHIGPLKPDMVGISCVSENYGRAIEMARLIKALYAVPIVVGGVHISSCPESLDPVFDAGVTGEGEETLLELIGSYPKLDNVQGVVTWKEGKVYIAPRRKMIADLDSLPMPDMRKWVEKLGMPYLMTTRGCLYHCSFCSSPVHWRGCRKFSPGRVITELRDIIDNFHPRHVRFFDDILTFDKKRLAKIIGMIRAEGFEKEVVFGCLSRVNMMDKDVINLLVEGNVKFVSLGVESVSKKVLRVMKDRGSQVTESQRAIDMAYNAGLYVSCSVIIGSPMETERELVSTYKFLEKNEDRLFEAEINPLVPHPGTPMWEYAKKRGLVSNDMDWSRLKDYSYLPMFNPDKYIYLNEKMPYKTFLKHIEKFLELHSRISLGKKKIEIMSKYFKPGDLPAKLKEVKPKGLTQSS